MLVFADPLATSCRVLLAVIEDQALPVDVRQISLAAGEQRRPEHLKLNPSGKVPVLIDGDFVLTEGLAIVRYLLADRDCSLYPAEPRRRARVNEYLDWVSTGLCPALLMGLVYPTLFAHLRHNIAIVDDALRERALETTRAALEAADQRLTRSGPYLLGDAVTLADYALAAALLWAPIIPLSLDRYPALSDWRGRIRTQKAWLAREAAMQAFTA